MSFNINGILGLAKTFMPNQVGKLQEAINKAQQVMNANPDKSPEEILKTAGVSKDFLDKLRQNTSNPLASKFLQAAGLDVNQANNILDNLTINCNNVSTQPSSTQQSDDIEMLKQALQKVKKN